MSNLDAMQSRLVRLEHAFVALAEFSYPGTGKRSDAVFHVLSTLLDEIRKDLAKDDIRG